MSISVTGRLRVCVAILRDLFEAVDRPEHFQLITPFSIDTLTLHLVEIRKVQATCFGAFNKMNVIADLPIVEMDGLTSLSIHEATYSMLEKAHARLTSTLAGFSQLESADRQREAIVRVLESLKTLPQFVWSELDAELRKEEIRVQAFFADGEPSVSVVPKRVRECAFDEAIAAHPECDWRPDKTLNNKAYRIRKGIQVGEIFGAGATERGWYRSQKNGFQVIKKNAKGEWICLMVSHSRKLKDFFQRLRLDRCDF